MLASGGFGFVGQWWFLRLAFLLLVCWVAMLAGSK
jgi:hypothetical protein